MNGLKLARKIDQTCLLIPISGGRTQPVRGGTVGARGVRVDILKVAAMIDEAIEDAIEEAAAIGKMKYE